MSEYMYTYLCCSFFFFFFFSSRRRHTRYIGDWSSDVCSSDLPLAGLVDHLRLQPPRGSQPFLEEADALRLGQLEEEVIRGLQHRLRPGEGRVRVDELRRRIDDAAYLARVRVLLLRMAVRALALDVPVRQEHALHRIEELLDRLQVDEALSLQPPLDVLRQLDVLGRVGRVPVIEAQVKALEIPGAARGDRSEERRVGKEAGRRGGETPDNV